MKILALDPATHCGWAHSDGASGTWDLSIRRDESAGMRLLRLRAKLNEILKLAGIDLVVFEAARFSGPKMGGALVVQSEIQGLIKVWCEDCTPKIPYRGYSSTEIKKRATGKGNANKEKMMAAASGKWGRKFTDDNEADACWLLDLAANDLGVMVQEAEGKPF